MSFSKGIREIVYLLWEKAVFSCGESFNSTFYNFIVYSKQFLKKNKDDKQKANLKYHILSLYKDIENCRIIPESLKENYQNQINTLVFSSELNKKEAEWCEELEDLNYGKLKKFCSFTMENISEEKEFSLWCFLKISEILKEYFCNVKSNIINENKLSSADFENEILKVSFSDNKENYGEALFNYNGVNDIKNAIYLIIKRYGCEPIYYIFLCNDKKPSYEEILKIHSLRDKTINKNTGFRLFSGIYILYPDNSFIKEEYEETMRNSLGAVPSCNEALTNLISEISSYEFGIYNSNMISAVSSKILKDEIEKRDTLIATVKSKEQLEINLKNGFYYMPLSHIKANGFSYNYIAIYQSRTLFGECAGITYYGKILDMKVLRRSEIPKLPSTSEELYVYFLVDWKKTDEKIKPDFFIKTFGETSFRLLMEKKNITELFIRFYDEYETLEFFKSNFKNVKIYAEESGIYLIESDEIKVEFNLTTVDFYMNEDNQKSFGRIFFRKNIKSILSKLKKEFIEDIEKNNSDK